MRVSKKNTTYEKHIYDLDLVSVFANYKLGIDQVELKYADKTPAYFTGLIGDSIGYYCNSEGINFNKAQQILLQPDKDGAYRYFLGISLIFLDIHLVRQYLNYHEKLFKTKTPTNDSFIGVVEFVLTHIIKHSSPFDNTKRLFEIMKWVKDKRKLEAGEKGPVKKRKPKQKMPTNKLIWEGNEFLKILISEKLCEGKYITRSNGLTKVFDQGETIIWLDSLESWAYLMSRLKKKPFDLTTSKGSRPYLVIGKDFFNFINEDAERIKKVKPSAILFNVTNRSASKYAKTRESIDSILNMASLSSKVNLIKIK